MNLLKKIKEFFNRPDSMYLIEERFYQRLEDMKCHLEKYEHILNRSTSNRTKIHPVSTF